VAAAAGTLALAVPISGASAATAPAALPGGALGGVGFPSGATAVPIGPQGSIGGTVLSLPYNGPTQDPGCATAGNTTQLLGKAGGPEYQVCAGLSFIGPAIGQINSQVGPTIIGSVILSPIVQGGGPVVNTLP
jgi:hypothetical protein